MPLLFYLVVIFLMCLKISSEGKKGAKDFQILYVVMINLEMDISPLLYPYNKFFSTASELVY